MASPTCTATAVHGGVVPETAPATLSGAVLLLTRTGVGASGTRGNKMLSSIQNLFWARSSAPPSMANFLIDTKDFSPTTGYGNDCRASLQNMVSAAAAQSKGLILTQKYGSSLNASTDAAVKIPSNFSLFFAPGAAIRLLPHNADFYHMLLLDSVSNVNIEGAFLDGAKEENGATTGEYGMGISLYDSSNVNIKRTKVINTWGDGYYIGGDAWSNNVNLWDIEAYGVRRNGMSVITCSGMECYSPRFGDITDTNPKCGIDFEPNTNAQRLRAINVYKPVTVANNLGIAFAPSGLMGSATQQVSINIYQWEDIRSLDTALNRYDLSHVGPTSGTFKIVNALYVKPNIQHDYASSYDNSIVWSVTGETVVS